MITLTNVKNALGITGDYQDSTLQIYFDEVMSFLVNAGVQQGSITVGIVARGVSDLWNYGGAEGRLSPYFMQRATQLSYGNNPNTQNYYLTDQDKNDIAQKVIESLPNADNENY